MKKLYLLNCIYFLLFLFILGSYSTQAQSWQWGKRGGTTDNTIQNYDTWERINSLATDTNGNVYMLASVGIANCTIDGIPLETYGVYTGGGNASIDYILSSFDCAGTHRW